MARYLTEEQYLRLERPDAACAQFNSRSPLRTSTRKFRLYLCACCRRVWDWLDTDANRAAVEGAERAADGLIRIKDLWPFYRATSDINVPLPGWPHGRVNPAHAASWPFPWPIPQSNQTTWLVAYYRGGTDTGRQQALIQAEHAAQVALIHDLLGNPFRPVEMDTAWLTPGVVRIAQAAYDERHLPSGELDRERLLVLSDALEEAGCTEERILSHLRDKGPHVRGCWVVDRVLGKA